ncbi:ABC transporter ATP-binding protein [Flavobacteriaceae bacterium]|jgi:iron complex transport system ATP-binding protein|nr:ABC transporter ATP-binding protein [Flavobacteriaceae bacterium]
MSLINQHIILKSDSLTVGYTTNTSKTVVASNINFELNQGELVGLVGVNGIGKSTLLRTLTGVQRELFGTIFLKGKHLHAYTNMESAKVMSVVLTEHIATKNLSVFEIIALGRHPYTNWFGSLNKTDHTIINTVMSQTNIEDLKHKKSFELSDGQLQKVMITRALAQDTDLIILDEPTTHLDLYHKVSSLKLLQDLAKNTGKTILFSSHEIDLAIQLCDRMIVMTEHEVISGTPQTLIEKGIFENLFPDDMIVFDNNTKNFKVKK